MEIIRNGTHSIYRVPKGTILNLVTGGNSVARATCSIAGVGPWISSGSPAIVGPFTQYAEVAVEVIAGYAGVDIAMPLPTANAFAVGINDSYFSGSTAQKLSQAVAMIQTQKGGFGSIEFDPGSAYTLTQAGTVLPWGGIQYNWNGCLIDASAIPNLTSDQVSAGLVSAAFAVVPMSAASTASLRNFQNPASNLIMQGPSSEASTVDGVYFGRGGRTYGEVAGPDIKELSLEGFRDSVSIGSNSWLIKFRGGRLSKSKRYLLAVGALENDNMGESIELHGTLLNNARNSAHTGCAIFIGLDVAATVKMIGGSLDFNDSDFLLYGGHLDLGFVHQEGNSAAPNGKMVYTPGHVGPKVTLVGGANPTAGPYGSYLEPTGGKDAMITVDGSGCVVDVAAYAWARLGQPNTQMVKVLSGNPSIRIEGLQYDVTQNAVPYVSKATSMITNGEFVTDLSGWLLPSTVNWIRNAAMLAGVAGSPGTRPTNWGTAGGLAGLTQTIAFDYSTGVPRLTLSLTGTPDGSSTSFGFTFDGNTAIPAKVGQAWLVSAYLQIVKKTGLTNAFLQIVERDGAGAGLSNQNLTWPLAYVRSKRVGVSKTIAAGAFVQGNIQLFFTTGVAVDCQIIIDSPMMTLAGDPLVDTVTENITLPTAQHRLAAGAGFLGANALEITNTGTGNYGVYQDVVVRPGRRALLRAQVAATITSGSASIRVDWMDASGNVIGSPVYVGGQITATTPSAAYALPDGTTPSTTFVQRGDVLTPPAMCAKARVWCYTTALNGTALFSNVYFWP